jgi:hypothetical protein
MNLREFLIGLFRSKSAKGDLAKVREAAREDARLMVGAYVDEFTVEAGRILSGRQQRFLGVETDVVDVEFQTVGRKRKKEG